MKIYAYGFWVILTLAGLPVLSQSKVVIRSGTQGRTMGDTLMDSPFHQAEYLLRKVGPAGVIADMDSVLPSFLYKILHDSLEVLSVPELQKYIYSNGIKNEEIGGNLSSPLSQNKKGMTAKYFVIHDVSTPNYLLDSFPATINTDSWKYNQVKRYWNKKKAHVFIGRTGKSFSPVYFNRPWRATKFEMYVLVDSVSKGLFLHVELIQPRRSDSAERKGNDVIAPNPGFTKSQYQRLALIYLCASTRGRKWLIPAFHATIDEGLKDAHDDPQNFDLRQFNEALKELYENIKRDTQDSTPLNLWATYYYVPMLRHSENGIDLLDTNESELGVKLDSCDWCNACIEGTVIIKKDSQVHVFNYAGRSVDIQYDCRKCKKYKSYDGYVKTGKVLWSKSEGFGEGVNSYKLIPFKSIAVDSSLIPFGSVIFIPQAKGTLYINEAGNKVVHDGYFFAVDMGSKIVGNHIDVFIGIATENPFSFVKSTNRATFEAYLVKNMKVWKGLEERHR